MMRAQLIELTAARARARTHVTRAALAGWRLTPHGTCVALPGWASLLEEAGALGARVCGSLTLADRVGLHERSVAKEHL